MLAAAAGLLAELQMPLRDWEALEPAAELLAELQKSLAESPMIL